MQSQAVTRDATWKRLVEGLPSTLDQISAAIRETLDIDGYLHLIWPMSIENYEGIAKRLGTVILRSDVKVDPQRANAQEHGRRIKGRGGIYSSSPLGFHTDPNADLVSWYCVEQDETGGPMLMLDMGDLEKHFSSQELEVLGRVDLWSPWKPADGPETLTAVPLISQKNGRYKIFYASWLLRDSYDSEATGVLEKFVGYVNRLEEKELILLPSRSRTPFLSTMAGCCTEEARCRKPAGATWSGYICGLPRRGEHAALIPGGPLAWLFEAYLLREMQWMR